MRESITTRPLERRKRPSLLPVFEPARADQSEVFDDLGDLEGVEPDASPAMGLGLAPTSTLTSLDGPHVGRQFGLATTCLVGRSPYNHVVLDDGRISRQHAKLSPEDGGFAVQDLESSNGTFVNDQKVERRTLCAGDVVRFGPFRFRFDAQASAAVDLARPSREVSRIAELSRLAQLEDAERKLRNLYTFVHAISATLHQTELLDLIVENLLEVFPCAELVAIYMLDPATTRMIPMRILARDRGDIPADFGKSMHLEDVAASSAGLAMHAPMLHGAGVLGVLQVRVREGAALSQGDLDLLNALAVHAALALTSSRMHQESLARERLAQDLVLAERIQRSFLPISLPAIEGVTFAADYEPAYSVGGDFYDVFAQGPGRVGIIVGDVSGKGVSAALLMARVSSDLRAAMMREPTDPATALDVVNKSICVRNQHDIFVTAICISIDVASRTATIASAGHLPPYVRRHRDGELVRVDDGASMPLGLFEDVQYHSTRLTLGPLDTLVLCTDGITEATSERSVQFGFDGMEQTLRMAGSSPSEICDRLLAAVRAHVGAAPQYDDLTLVVCGMDDTGAALA